MTSSQSFLKIRNGNRSKKNKNHIFGFMTMIEVLISDFNLEHDETMESILQAFPQNEAVRSRVMGVPSNWTSILNDIVST